MEKGSLKKPVNKIKWNSEKTNKKQSKAKQERRNRETTKQIQMGQIGNNKIAYLNI